MVLAQVASLGPLGKPECCRQSESFRHLSYSPGHSQVLNRSDRFISASRQNIVWVQLKGKITCRFCQTFRSPSVKFVTLDGKAMQRCDAHVCASSSMQGSLHRREQTRRFTFPSNQLEKRRNSGDRPSWHAEGPVAWITGPRLGLDPRRLA